MTEVKDAEVKDKVYENETYTVHIVRIPDMFFDTYGIINRKTGVIEQVHPNMFNVCKIADQFDRWLREGADDDDAEGFVLSGLIGPDTMN